MKQLVSIIIPTFNRGNLIKETLDSIINQSHANWECLVIDDGSTDNTEEILQKYINKDPRFQFYKRSHELIKGVSVCRNIGFKISKGEFINFVDSDDLMTPNHIEIHLKNFSNNNIECSVTNAKIFTNNKENTKGFWSKNIFAEDIVSEMIKNDVLWAIGSVIWKRSAFKNLNTPFFEDLICSEEWAMHLFQIVNGCKYHIDLETTFLVRNHENRVGKISSLSKTMSIYKARIYILDLLKSQNCLTKQRELYLLKDVFFALRLTIKNNYFKLMLNILGFVLKNLVFFKNKGYAFKILFVAFPIYSVTRKGEKLFKI